LISRAYSETLEVSRNPRPWQRRSHAMSAAQNLTTSYDLLDDPENAQPIDGIRGGVAEL
jgi:hypothetical protein